MVTCVMMTVFLGPLGGPESHQSTAAMTGVGPLPPPWTIFLQGGRGLWWRLGPVSWAFLSPVFRDPTVKIGYLSWQRFTESTFGVTRSWVLSRCSQMAGFALVPFLSCCSFLSSLAWYLLVKTLMGMSIRELRGVWGPLVSFWHFWWCQGLTS